jgi:IclR family KDG regulon transcriptional repressor
VYKLIESVSRALKILSFIGDHNEIGVRELSRALGINEATVYRSLVTLQKHGYVMQDMKTKKYKLGFETVRIGQSCLRNFDFLQVARRFSIELSRRTNESIALLARHENDAIYVDMIDSPHVVRIHAQIGSKMPINFEGFTKPIFVFLSEQEQIELVGKEQFNLIKDKVSYFKSKGYTFSEEEVDYGVFVVGCPVYNYENKIIGALNIPIPIIRYNEQNIPEIAQSLIITCNSISKEFGYRA